jgi:hypothetical protein
MSGSGVMASLLPMTGPPGRSGWSSSSASTTSVRWFESSDTRSSDTRGAQEFRSSDTREFRHPRSPKSSDTRDPQGVARHPPFAFGLPDTHRFPPFGLPDTHRLARGHSNRRQSLGVWGSLGVWNPPPITRSLGVWNPRSLGEFGCLEPPEFGCLEPPQVTDAGLAHLSFGRRCISHQRLANITSVSTCTSHP